MTDADMNLIAAPGLIEGDRALAAAVLKAVNWSLCGLKRRVPSVQPAITYLGMFEVSAVAFELGSRAAFLPSSQLAPEHRRSMLRAAGEDSESTSLELAGFGVSHDALGAALCESRGLGQAAVASVCHHVRTQATGSLPGALVKRPICALSVLVAATMRAPDALDAVARAG